MAAHDSEQDNSLLADMAGINEAAEWAVDFAGNGQVTIVDLNDRNREIAYMPLESMTEEELDSHTSLIVAAPAMRRALEIAETSMLDSGYSTDNLVIKIVRAALAKARGQE